ncbi:MAG TPA: FMN-binding protein [Streptosporangiaceae bacterium]
MKPVEHGTAGGRSRPALRRAPLLVIGGAVAGLAGVVGWHTWGPAPGAAAALGHPAAPAEVAPPGVHSATGPVEWYSFGTIAVRVTVDGSRITAVSVPVLHPDDPTSQQIASQAIPVLRSEVLAARSAAIHAVSGATYTSRGYVESLQAALDKLHA